jgi:hypothetical protein
VVVEGRDLFGFVQFRPLGSGNGSLTNFGSVFPGLRTDDFVPCEPSVARAGKPG